MVSIFSNGKAGKKRRTKSLHWLMRRRIYAGFVASLNRLQLIHLKLKPDRLGLFLRMKIKASQLRVQQQSQSFIDFFLPGPRSPSFIGYLARSLKIVFEHTALARGKRLVKYIQVGFVVESE